MERDPLSHLTTTLEAFLPDEQGDFEPSCSTCDQVLALSTIIKAGFQRKQKMATTLVDLSAACDTGLLLKVLKVFHCQKAIRLLSVLLGD